MAEQSDTNPGLHAIPWVSIQDEETGLQASFPHTPLEMTFDLPFQNTPPEGQVHLYSVPTQHGLFVLSTFRSSKSLPEELNKEELYAYFKEILVPHFFFNPAVFLEHQTYHFQPITDKEHPRASFQFFFQDHQEKKRLEGIALLDDQTLFISFYLASEKDFDQQLLQRFLDSINY